jgi:hypothetical protein
MAASPKRRASIKKSLKQEPPLANLLQHPP